MSRAKHIAVTILAGQPGNHRDLAQKLLGLFNDSTLRAQLGEDYRRRAWTVLGMLHKQRGEFEKAKQAYQRALEIDPNAGLAANNLAWLYCAQGGDLDAALDLARRARQALSKSPVVSDTLGWMYYKRQLYDSAIPVLQEAVRDAPKNGEYRFHLAASLLAAGKKEQAKSELNTALRLDGGLRKRQDVQKVIGQL